MPQDKLRVGTLTANYNNGKEFPDCLKSILEQETVPNVITIVDDGSKDNSWEIIKEECQKYYKPSETNVLKNYQLNDYETVINGITFKLIKLLQNKGPSFARNIALQYLIDKVDVIAIADADDIYYPAKISKSINIMKRYPQVALVYSDYDVLDLSTNNLAREYKEIYSFKRLFEECIVSNNSIIASSIIKIVGGYDNSIRGGEDYDLWLRIGEVAAIYHIPEALYQYRLTGKNATVTTPQEKFAQDIRKVHTKAIQRRNRNLGYEV